MPGKNTIKQYLENGYYHIYNRGVEKRKIFITSQDYGVFLGYLKEYLSPKDTASLQKLLATPNFDYKERDNVLKALRLNNFYKEIDLLVYCLMPNHFHLLIKQRGAQSMDKFIQSLCTRYTLYINKKYKRVGTLFQGVYKAVLVNTDEQLLQLSKYIHKQARYFKRKRLVVQPSSHPEYLGQRKTKWVKPGEIIGYFSQVNPQKDYARFVEEEQDITLISKLVHEI